MVPAPPQNIAPAGTLSPQEPEPSARRRFYGHVAKARNRALHYLAGSYELSDELRHQLTQVVYGYAGRCDEDAARECLEWMRGEPNVPRATMVGRDAKRVEQSGWSAELTRTITLKDGTQLHTLADVRAFILNGPEHIQERQAWQYAAQLLLDAAEDAGRDATRQVEFALFLEAH